MHYLADSGRLGPSFRPSTPTEFFALQLALRLRDTVNVARYIALTEHYRDDQILRAVRGLAEGPESSGIELLEAELGRMTTAPPMGNSKLLAIKVERRTVAAAVFVGLHLDYTQVRQLSSSHTKAESSALGFVHWLAGMFDAESVAMEVQSADSPIRRADLTRAIVASVRGAGLAVWETTKHQLFEAFAVPPLKTRKQLREIVSSFWPILEDDRLVAPVMDAAALGLYVQVQRKLQS
jgi:hypothetical protein